jgi:hypothetical protein
MDLRRKVRRQEGDWGNRVDSTRREEKDIRGKRRE